MELVSGTGTLLEVVVWVRLLISNQVVDFLSSFFIFLSTCWLIAAGVL